MLARMRHAGERGGILQFLWVPHRLAQREPLIAR